MQFQLQATETERANDDLAVALLGLVSGFDPADAERRLGVGVGEEFDRRVVLPIGLVEKCEADGTRRKDDLRALTAAARAALSLASIAVGVKPNRS